MLMNSRIVGLTLAAIITCGSVSAEDWAYLGGSPAGEMDTTSIVRDGGLIYLHVRLIGDLPQGRGFLNQILAVDCLEKTARISDGWMTSNFSSRVVPMPNLPEDQRVIFIPTPNEAYNNMFAYVCGGN